MADPLDPTVPLSPPGPHPTPEQLYRARRGPRTAEAERWLEHAAVCAACTEELLRQEAFDEPAPVSSGRLAAAWDRFGEQEDRPATPAAQLAAIVRINPHVTPSSLPGRTAPRRAPWMATLAAGVAAVACLGVWTSTHHPLSQPQPQAAVPPHVVVRGAGDGDGETGRWLPAGLLDSPPSEIVFPMSGEEAKQVVVFDKDHDYFWTSPPTVTGKVLFPASEQKRLLKGVDYYWTVVGQEGGAAPQFRLR